MRPNLSLAMVGITVLLAVVVSTLCDRASAQAGPPEFKVLYTFTGGSDGSYPTGKLISDAAGNLYGTTGYGGNFVCLPGNSGCGVVFKLTPSADGRWTQSVLYRFNGNDGNLPGGGLVLDAAGNLYGTTEYGGAGDSGTVYKLSPNADGSWTETLLHSFPGGVGDGYIPAGGLTFDADGNLYGTTVYGGSDWMSGGIVFKLTPNPDGSWTESVLHSMRWNHPEGSNPVGSLIFDAAGNLYGTTSDGEYAWGAVFKLSPNPDGTWTERTLHSFAGGKDGGTPGYAVTFDSMGNLYGMTSAGGTNGLGTVFMLIPRPRGNWAEHVLENFGNGLDGSKPYAELIFDGSHNLYGTTGVGGTDGFGTIFKLTPGPGRRWKAHVVHNFTSHCDTVVPVGGLMFDAAGHLYGTTSDYSGEAGVVYEIPFRNPQ